MGDGGDVLVRRGTSWESPRRLARQAKQAREAGFRHGVSVTVPEANLLLARDPTDVSQASRRALEDAGLKVHPTPTRRDPNHHTIELPDPVTDEVAEVFNRIFGRAKK